MTLEVRYFASLREALGFGETVSHVPGETVQGLRQRLQQQGAAHADALADHRALRAAVNHSLADNAAELPDGAEVAFFPPVTGG